MTVFVQVNLDHSIVCNSDLHVFIKRSLDKGTAVIAGLQEPYVNKWGRITSLPDSGLVYARDNKGGTARAALYISNGLNVIPVMNYIDRDMAVVRWVTGEESIGEEIRKQGAAGVLSKGAARMGGGI